MMVLMLGAGLCLLPLLLSLAVRLRLGIPLVYVLLMLTVFHGWYQAHTALAEHAAAKRLAQRVRQARAAGTSVVDTEGLWR